MERRKFLSYTLGGLVALPVIQACDILDSSDAEDTTTADIQKLQTAVTMEGRSIATYNAATSLVANQANKNTLLSFRDSHLSHAEFMNNTLVTLGASEIDYATLSADPRGSGVSTELDVINLALELEKEACLAYFGFISTTINTATVRNRFADIFPIEYGHFLKLSEILGLPENAKLTLFSDLTA